MLKTFVLNGLSMAIDQTEIEGIPYRVSTLIIEGNVMTTAISDENGNVWSETDTPLYEKEGV